MLRKLWVALSEASVKDVVELKKAIDKINKKENKGTIRYKFDYNAKTEEEKDRDRIKAMINFLEREKGDVNNG